MSTAEELERLVALRDRGVLSEEEFQAEKARVLGQSSAAEGPSESPPPTEPLSPRPSASSEDPTSPGFVVSPPRTPVPPTRWAFMGAPWTNRAVIHNKMITYLEANPSKASAWAAAEGISVNQISTYIGGLDRVPRVRGEARAARLP